MEQVEIEPSEVRDPEIVSTEIRTALSPSRASDFLTCPLLYRFRTIDRFPEPPDPVAVRGTLVHAVLESLFGEDAVARTLERAQELLPETWDALRADHPDLAELEIPDGWMDSAGDLLGSYFALEDPSRVEPEATELRVDHVLESGLSLGGIIDRLDVAPDGRIRVVDFKTGKAPHERFEDKSLFQMKFYALIIWRTRGVIPTLLQLYYLADRTVLSYEPAESDLLATERKVVALWNAIQAAVEREQFPPRPSALCQWCRHQDKCPEFGGETPPMPAVTLVPAGS
ncbi:MAG TPA: PD-(D/E)XK nuclease family protein [Aeromicrobium sp.]|nr:PD-(D/E)XK nuclease family protein [Aeromicrobium sp.]HKY56769.1 PD-(D/E)XK nuclease family protein [Aeromicrobium sp.]